MTPRLQKLSDLLSEFKPMERLNEITIEVEAAQYRSACERLRGEPYGFEQMLDLCGVDYASYGDKPREGSRFAVVLHLLSIKNNWRLRVRVFCPDDSFPVVASLVEVWPSASWYEREAFDLFGIDFKGHPNLVRIMLPDTWQGHPLRRTEPLGSEPVDFTVTRNVYAHD